MMELCHRNEQTSNRVKVRDEEKCIIIRKYLPRYTVNIYAVKQREVDDTIGYDGLNVPRSKKICDASTKPVVVIAL